MGFSIWMNGSSALLDQRRHADHETGGNGDDHGQQIARHDPQDGVAELNAQPHVVGAAHVERVFQVPPHGGGHVEGAGHRRFALGGGEAHQLGVFRVHRLPAAAA